MELIRPIVRVGNSAGVVLPREWLHGKARVTLIEKSLQPEKEVFEVLKEYLSDMVALAIVGSYARGEQTADSDVDALVITRTLNKRIKQGKYEIILISEKALEQQLANNILPLLPMLLEAKPLINKEIFEKFKTAPLTKRNLAFHFETTKTAMNVIKEWISLADELEEEEVSDAIAYSLILRLREWYIVNCLLKNKKYAKKDFLNLVKNIAGSLKSYEGYERSKQNKSKDHLVPASDVKKLEKYIRREIETQEARWVKKSI